MAKSDKMYAESPTIGKGEDGKPVISKATKKADAVQAGTDGMSIHTTHAHERRDVQLRHEMEQMQLHRSHEKEHATYESTGGDKGGLQTKHLEELVDMHKRHAAELKKIYSKHAKGGISHEEDKTGMQAPKKEKVIKGD